MISCGFMARCHGQQAERWRQEQNSTGKAHTTADILLVGEYEEEAVLHFTVIEDSVQFCPSLFNTRAVRRVDNEDQGLGSCGATRVSPSAGSVGRDVQASRTENKREPYRYNNASTAA